MALAAGTRLGPYEIVAALGAGGMGEVYQARDTRLDRTVAIKVLPAELSADPERRARFEREARTIAALNHPHICTLHDIGQHDGTTYLVMEHLVGEALAQRLRKGALPVPQALEIGAQVAEALDAAHKAGIVHRDLKPANVMLTKSGATLLDFGLAKLRPGKAIRLVRDSSAATQADDVTVAGTLIGTMPYMAPEQVEGRDTDARTDLWAFGCVLYEMVTGQRAFAGETPGSLIGAILAKAPEPLATRQPLTPPGLERLVARCLAKDPDQRWDSAHDVADELRWIAQTSAMPRAPELPAAIAAPAGRTTSPRRWLGGPAVGALAFIAGAVAAALVTGFPRTDLAPHRRVVRFDVEVPVGRVVSELALSPDASHIVYVGVEAERPPDRFLTARGDGHLFVRRLDQLATRELAGTDDATSPFFSPDGRWIGFIADGRLKKVPVDGGQPVTVAEVPGRSWGLGAVWTVDDTIIGASATAGLWRVPAAGGTPTPLTTPDSAKGELHHASPLLLPDGRTLLFSILRGFSTDPIDLEAVSLDSGTRRPVANDGSGPSLVGDRYLVCVTRAGLSAARFDTARAHLDGKPLALIDDLEVSGYTPLYALSRSGDLAYVAAESPAPTHVLEVDATGRERSLVTVPSGLVRVMSLAPDGRRLLLTRKDQRHYTLEMLDIPRGVMTRLVADASPHAGVWSPDGQRMLYSANLGDVASASVFMQAADGSGTGERLVVSSQHGDPGSWSSDGRWIAYAELDPVNRCDLWKLDMATRQASPFRRTRAEEKFPALSPDGRWLAYASDESGRWEVYVEAFPSGGCRVQVSASGGNEPLWAVDGARLFFREGPRVLAVTVGAGTELSLSPPAVVLEGQFEEGQARGPVGYAVAPDAQHFYFLRTESRAPRPTRIQVVLDWADELEKRFGGS